MASSIPPCGTSYDRFKTKNKHMNFMAYIKKLIWLLLVIGLIPSACQFDASNEAEKIKKSEVEELSRTMEESTRFIFYNMFLPCEMVYIFRDTDLDFDETLVNDPENAGKYNANHKRAVNLGVYGVDLGYLRINNQPQEIKDYGVAINNMANDLGIPDEHVNHAMRYLRSETSNVDSLYEMTCDLFEITDSYLNNNERQSASALIIFGGWIEALYITSHLVDSNIPEEIMNRVARQKYSLKSLMSLLKMYEDNMAVTNYLVMLKSLQDVYDEIELYYEDEDDIDIDTINKKIYTDKAQSNINKELFLRIKNEVSNIRHRMVM